MAFGGALILNAFGQCTIYVGIMRGAEKMTRRRVCDIRDGSFKQIKYDIIGDGSAKRNTCSVIKKIYYDVIYVGDLRWRGAP